jgi:site-specific DNA-cytosine methylase
MLYLLKSPPRTIVLENVVGFECSDCCRTWLKALLVNGYHVEHFHLTPTSFGFPNERPRYYLIAKYSNLANLSNRAEVRAATATELVGATANGDGGSGETMLVKTSEEAQESTFDDSLLDLPISSLFPIDDDNNNNNRRVLDVRKVKDFLELPEWFEFSSPSNINNSTVEASGSGGGGESLSDIPVDSSDKRLPEWLVPWHIDGKVMDKDSSWCFDIVKGSDVSTAW